ncbi:hypothetical protein [Schaalia sp. ZJ1691]|nr:hypothetical protein [Schaalia sp. ZJ1691]
MARTPHTQGARHTHTHTRSADIQLSVMRGAMVETPFLDFSIRIDEGNIG